MVALRINIFGGMIPAQDDRLLPDGAASLAENTWMYSGSLEGMKSPRFIRNLTDANAKRVYRIPMATAYEAGTFATSTWMEFSDIDVEVVRAPVRDDSYQRYYWLGPSTTPTYNTLSRIASGSAAYKLGIPQPGSAPNVTAPVTPDDTVAPVPVSASVVGSLLTIVFNEERRLDAVNAPPAKAFRVTSPTREFTIESVAVDGPNRKIGLLLGELAEPNEVVTVVYTDPTSGNDKNALQDEAGNDVASFTLTCGNDTTDRIGPQFKEAHVTNNALTIWFTDANALATTNLPGVSAFKVVVDSSPVTINSLSVDSAAKAVILSLQKNVPPGAVVYVSYTDPTISNDTVAIQDTIGNDAIGFTSKAVTNFSADVTGPTLSATSAINNIVNLKFNKKLQSNTPATERFAVTVNGTSYVPFQVNVDGEDSLVVLSLLVTTVYGDIVTVTYNAADGAPVKILDQAGNGAYGWGVTQVVNQNTFVPTYDPNTGGGGGGNN